MADLNVNSIGDASGGTTTTVNGYTPTVSNMAGRNRIINGDMRIDQRNAGASVTPANGEYTVDRWKLNPSQASKITVQQTPSATEAGYTTRVGAGFSNYLACTTASAATIGAADYFQLSHSIEGLNISDLAWGTSAAQSITLSFWVYSSLTGTFGGSLSNSGQAVGYAFNYSISSANTWTKITLAIPGPTTGTWLTTNSTGILIIFSLGVGSNYFGTANTWLTQNYINSPSGCVNVVETAGATFFITGVQLEAGSVSTPFEHRQYGQELALCQRYFCKNFAVEDRPANGLYGDNRLTIGAMFNSTGVQSAPIAFPVTMRANPTITFYNPSFVSTAGSWGIYPMAWGEAGFTPNTINVNQYRLIAGGNISGGTDYMSYIMSGYFVASAEL